MDKDPSITRTCLACGTAKPIAAFLQMSGTQGTIYGNICSTCRSDSAKKGIVEITEEGRGSSRAGLKIDASAKIQLEHELKLLMEKTHNEKVEDRKDIDEKESEKAEKRADKEKSEKAHRKEYIEAKQKFNFLQRPAAFDSPTQVTNTEKAGRHQQERLFNQQQKDEATKQELNQTTDFNSGASIDPGVAGLRFQIGESQQRLEALLGPNALMNTVKNKFGIKPKEAAQPKEKSPASKDDPLVDYAKDSLGSSRRR